MKLKDKVVIITGGTGGIGKAIAKLVIENGAKVLIHGINEAEGKAALAQLGENAKLHLADLADEAAPQSIVDACLKEFGRIDAIVNNAATIERGKINEIKPSEFDRIMAVNIRSSLFLIQAAFDELKKNRGVVLNIGSINAYSGESSLLIYSISKGAMQTMSRNLANAHGKDGVRVNQINPGWVLTEREYVDQIKKGMPENWPDTLPREHAPSGRIIKPEEIAVAAMYWISDESYPITGSVTELEQFSIFGRNPEK
ncbi:MAG: SDR family oxidoreductase [Candidatus Nanopelagicales bacterium]